MDSVSSVGLINSVLILFGSLICCSTNVIQDASLPIFERKTVSKDSSVNFQWKYVTNSSLSATYELVIGYKSGSEIIPLVKKGEVVLPLVPEFLNRVNTSGNSLIIKNLQFNDTLYTFAAYVAVNVTHPKIENYNVILRPVYKITVVGAPEYSKSPTTSTIQVNEGSTLRISTETSCNPRPVAEFYWSHQVTKLSVNPAQEYQFSYTASYTLKQATSEYCGRILNSRFFNTIGSSNIKQTTIKMTFNSSLGFSASWSNSSCLQISWMKRKTEACIVQYRIALLNDIKAVLSDEMHENISHVLRCNTLEVFKAKYAVLAVTSNSSIEAKEAEIRIPNRKSQTTIDPTRMVIATTRPNASSSNTSKVAIHYGYGCLILVVCFFLFGLVIWNLRMKTRENGGCINPRKNAQRDNGGEFDPSRIKHYMDLQIYEDPNPKNYAALENSSYEVTRTQEYDRFSKEYVNVSNPEYVNVVK